MADPLGLDTINETREDECRYLEQEEAAAVVAGAIDNIARLSKLLPIPEEASARFRRAIFAAWTKLVNDCSAGDSHAFGDELETTPGE